MTTTFQLCNQRRAQNRFLRAVTALALCAATVSLAGCAQDSWRLASRLALSLTRTQLVGTGVRGLRGERVLALNLPRSTRDIRVRHQ
jgi:hypothetical protein